MITLQQAIDLATKAHEGKWRKSQELDNASIDQYIKTPEDILFPYTLPNRNRIFYHSDSIVMQKPYITHPLAVMEMMSTEEEKIVAVLHDILEDTDITTAYLKHQGVPSHLINNLEWLTPIKGEPYEDYIKNISNYSLATKVKLADIFHSLSDNPSEHTKQKYLKAIPILLQNI